ncbi:hypothetical protein [Pseudomonas nitroreducens]|uniref:hypothetical protein n=1 Tax=Pseudomonas nitroreducens TaxID=46680 RepID=UPI002D8048E1|nr:hypothetical protein [Pseudomonas nitroreducens]
MSLSTGIAVGIMLVVLGTGGGVWVASRDLRPALDQASQALAVCHAGRDNLEALTTEQGAALGQLVQLADERREASARALELAAQESAADYTRAQRIQQEHTAGADQCAAAAAVIDQELGL